MADPIKQEEISTAENLEELGGADIARSPGAIEYEKALADFKQQYSLPIGSGMQPTQTSPDVGRVFGEGRGATGGEQALGFMSRLSDFATNFASAYDKSRQSKLEELKLKSPFEDPYAARKNREFQDKVFTNVVTRFNSDPIVKTWKESVTAYNQVVALSEQDTAAAANALVTKFMKVIDPPSIVRETEVKMGKESAGFVQGLINKINEGNSKRN
jgi:hypothetical protein